MTMHDPQKRKTNQQEQLDLEQFIRMRAREDARKAQHHTQQSELA